ncbi:MAG: M23 family metallopeptidase [Pseudomonadota bacterium]
MIKTRRKAVAKATGDHKTLAAMSTPPARSSKKFLWPLEGSVVEQFGAQGAGLYNDGINIAAPQGHIVRAAENGIVVYTGSDLGGFGNLILLRHADGYISAYAHVSTISVKRGQNVKRGETIAKVGSSGLVDTPQLHFEIRKGGDAINPILMLPSISTSA